MQGMHKNQWHMRQTSIGAACVLLAAVLLSGCAGQGNTVPVAVAQPEAAPVKSFSVERLTDGQDGFIIHENPDMDEASRRNFEQAVALINAGEFEQATGLLEKVIDRSPGVSAPYINLAIACEHLGKTEQAEENFKTALRLVPDHPVACNEYGLLCRKAGRFAEARQLYEKALDRFPEYYPLHRNLGILCDLYLDDSECALSHYEQYSAARPDDEQVKLWLADLHNRL